MKKQLFLIVSAVAAVAMFSCNKETALTTHDEIGTSTVSSVETKAYGDKTPKMTVYVETNDVNPLNALDYNMSGGGKTFDIVELFAANLNEDPYNTDVPCIYFNKELVPYITNHNTYIKPLQDAGIKVTLTLLPNWDDMGLCTLDDDQAEVLAGLLSDAVNEYGLDGVSFDDEYEGNNFVTVSGSYGNLITKLRALLPNKLITVFQYGHYGQIDSTAGSYIDYAYTNFSYYYLNSSSSISGVTNAHWAPMSINLGYTYSNYVRNYYINPNAATAANNGYGALMFFNLRRTSDVNAVPVLTSVTSGAFGETTTVSGGDRSPATAASTGMYYTIDGKFYM